MKKKAIISIAVITFLSLAGIIYTQVFWVEKSLSLKEEQFDNSVRIAVKSTLNRLLEYKNDTSEHHYPEIKFKPVQGLNSSAVVPPVLLDSLLHEELGYMLIEDTFYFAIHNAENKFLYGGYENYESKLLESAFQFSLENIYDPGSYTLAIYFPTKTSILFRQMEGWLLISVFFVIFVVISFAYVIYIILRQKKISEMKTDFINNLTHEFKTPIATSSLAAEMLLRPEVNKNQTRISKYANVILDENIRLQNQVEQVLQIATLETGKIRYKFRLTDIHKLLETVIDTFDLRMKDKDVNLKIEFKSRNYSVVCDRTHMLNVFYNLLDNAIKYSHKNPSIVIETREEKKGMHICFRDNGIGISFEHQPHIFKNLFRVPTGNIHEARGFGLGLYYAKTIVDQHKGNIEIESELGKGSVFDVYLPYNLNNL